MCSTSAGRKSEIKGVAFDGRCGLGMGGIEGRRRRERRGHTMQALKAMFLKPGHIPLGNATGGTGRMHRLNK